VHTQPPRRAARPPEVARNAQRAVDAKKPRNAPICREPSSSPIISVEDRLERWTYSYARRNIRISNRDERSRRYERKGRNEMTKQTRRVFKPGQCHWRAGGLGDSVGPSACNKRIVAKRANLCPAHEAIWQKAARARYAANRAANAVVEPKPAAPKRESNAEARERRARERAAAQS
jgi:hypothetical protein